MPIRKDLRHYYGQEWKKEIRPRILARAKHKCEHCDKPNRAIVETRLGALNSTVMFWRFPPDIVQPGYPNGSEWRDQLGGIHKTPPRHCRIERFIRVVLTVAHLDHNPANMDDSNLAALCQWCHLNHDKAHHADTRGTRKDQARPILQL